MTIEALSIVALRLSLGPKRSAHRALPAALEASLSKETDG
jgi:hypothetical protein